MPRIFKALFILCMAASSASAASPKKNPDAERAVKSELLNRTFQTKILIGSYIPCPESNRNNAIRLIDTELSSDGSIKSFATSGCNYPGGFFLELTRGHYVEANFSSSIRPGTMVWVRRVNFMADRVEVWLSTNNSERADGYGKIKFMLGPEYRDWPTEQVMEAIAQGIAIPAYERIAQLKSEYESLRASLKQAEQKYDTAKVTASMHGANERRPSKEVEPLKKVHPVYPPIAKAAHVEGTVVLDVLVGKDGSVESVTAVGGPPLLQQSAIEAVKQWKYPPSMVNGEAVEFKVEPKVKILFTLGGVSSPPQEQDSPEQEVLADAIALRQVLEKLQRNRAEFAAKGKNDPDAGIYAEKLKDLIPEISRLSEKVHQQQRARQHDLLQSQLQDISKIQAQVRQKPPSSLAEWQERSDLLATYSTLLDSRQKLLDGLHIENESPSPEDTKFINDGRTEIAADRSTLEHSRQQIELIDLTTQYGQLTKKRAQLLDAYSRAFGTSKEKSTLQELIAVLGQIIANREQAAGHGDSSAAAQLARYRTEEEKFKRK